jgi:CRP/FNR family transcriptional regulator
MELNRHINLYETFRQTFEPGLIEEIEKRSTLIEAQAGDTIIDIGQTASIIPLLLNGTMKVSRQDDNGKELLLYYIQSHESCAMTFTCCMQQFPSEVRSVAESDCLILAIPTAVMDEWLGRFPTWKAFVMRTIRNRFHELLHTIDLLAFQKLDERLTNYLKEKARISGSSLLNLSHEAIALELASSREVISRLLKKLENDNKVILYRNQIKLIGAL